MDNLHLLYLKAMGVTLYKVRSDDDSQQQQLSWVNLAHEVATCRACNLHCSRSNTVLGDGNQQAKLMIVGEAPGFYEDQQGKPFVGKAGQLLQAMLHSMALSREQVYITNILKCRPPDNRTPQDGEVKQCTPFLRQQINLVSPQFLLVLGSVAAHYLLNTKNSVSSLRGKVYSYENYAKLIVTYHPAYLLRNPQDKEKAYKDLQTLTTVMYS